MSYEVNKEYRPNSGVSKSWGPCTLNNWTQEEYEKLTEMPDISYLIIGKEVGKSGTPHLQFFVTFKKAKRLICLKAHSPRAHWIFHNPKFHVSCGINYCKKEGDWNEWGVKQQGKRNDLKSIYEAAKSGMPFDQFLLANTPNLQQQQIFKVAKAALMQDRPILTNLQVIWLWGATGCGKSRMAYEAGAFRVPSFKWWDGYDGQKAVWFDEVRGDFCKYHEWLSLLDIYPFQKEIKGGWVKVQFDTVYITCDRPPHELFRWCEEDLQQLLRRVTKIIHFSKNSKGETVTEVTKDNTVTLVTPPPFVPSEADLDEL